MALPQINKIPLRLERSRIDKIGVIKHSKLLSVVVAQSPENINHPRFALLISNKTLPLSVARHRLKRKIVSILEKILPAATTQDYLIIPKRQALLAHNDEIFKELKTIICLG